VEQQQGPVEGGRHFFEETVAKNLRLGRFLTMIVGDRIRQSLVDMLNHVNRYPHLATDVALVEMHCYRWQGDEEWPLLVVPSVIARTQVVERSVIQVTVKQDGAHEVDVRQEKAEPKVGGRSRVTLTEEAFWEMLMETTPEAYENTRRLITEYQQREGIGIQQRTSSLVVSLDFLEADRPPTAFFVNVYGWVNIWPNTLGGQLRSGGIDPQIAQRYGEQLRTVLDMPPQRKELSGKVAEIDLSAFMAAVDAFIEDVQQASADLS
jgi:hypothetical protein